MLNIIWFTCAIANIVLGLVSFFIKEPKVIYGMTIARFVTAVAVVIISAIMHDWLTCLIWIFISYFPAMEMEKQKKLGNWNRK